jgi:DNA-binding SARP family transcriptional activator
MEQVAQSIAPATEVPTILRIRSFGPLTLEWHERSTGNTIPLSEEKLHGKGATPTLSLLKLLICQPHRSASRDWILEQFWPETESSKAEGRIDDVASHVRTLLISPSGKKEPFLLYMRNSKNSGGHYRLAAYPLIWVDTDAFEWSVQQAARLDRFGHDSLSLWEQAYQLAARGMFLPEEQYSDWAIARREKLEGQYRQCVHRLVHVLREKGADEEALLRLRDYWQQHKTDEDALRMLLEMLGEREQYQEAERYYEQAQEALEHDGRELDAKTCDVMDFMRTLQIQRAQNKQVKAILPSIVQSSLTSPSLSGTGYIQEQIPPSLKDGNEQNAILVLPIATLSAFSGDHLETPLTDCATFFGVQLAEIMMLIRQWYGMAAFCNELQNQLDRTIKKFDQRKMQYPADEYALSRRSLLTTLAALPTSLLASYRQGQKTTLVLEELLPTCAASITACWYLSGGTHLDAILPLLDSYLPTLIATCKYTTAYYEIAADLVAQIYFLKAILAWHLTGLEAAEMYCTQGMNYGNLTKNINLRLTALNQLALISYYGKDFQKALVKSEEAEMIVCQHSHEYIFPIVQGRVYMYLAAIQAQQKLQGKAENTLENAHKAFSLQFDRAESVPLYADCGNAPLMLWDGLTHYYLSKAYTTHKIQALNALQTFGQLLPTVTIPERFRLECLNNRALAAIQLGEMEEAIACVEAGKQGAMNLESKQRHTEVEYVQLMMLKQWPQEKRVQRAAKPPTNDV